MQLTMALGQHADLTFSLQSHSVNGRQGAGEVPTALYCTICATSVHAKKIIKAMISQHFTSRRTCSNTKMYS